MNAVLLDTNVVSFVLKGHSLAEAYRVHIEKRLLVISFMTVAEMYEGAYRAHCGRTKLRRLEAALRGYVVAPYTSETCRRWGQVRYERRRQPISGEDAWIAATALEHGVPLVTHNPDDFGDITGLQVLTAT